MAANENKPIVARIIGTRPLLLSSAAGAAPRGEIGDRLKELNALRRRTVADEAERDWLKYRLALYCDDKIGPFLPGYNLWAAVRDAAAIHRLKTKWIQGAMVVEEKLPLEYDGPRTAKELYDNARFVDARPARVKGGGTILAVRPIFPEWKLRATFMINDAAISPGDAKRAIQLAGELTGVGTFRQRFGRFDVQFD
jgi:hypothetical protein